MYIFLYNFEYELSNLTLLEEKSLINEAERDRERSKILTFSFFQNGNITVVRREDIEVAA